jgi:hypothetical protein
VASIQGAKVTVTLTPTDTLMDGSRAQTVTRTMTLEGKGGSGVYLYLRDIPLGDYTATVSMAAPGAAAFPLRLRVLGGEWQQSASVIFEPTTSGYTKTAQVLGTR